LKRPARLSEKQTARLGEILKINLASVKASVKAYLMRKDFQRFWEYKSRKRGRKITGRLDYQNPENQTTNL